MEHCFACGKPLDSSEDGDALYCEPCDVFVCEDGACSVPHLDQDATRAQHLGNVTDTGITNN